MKQIIYDCDNTMGLPFKEIDDGLTLLYLLGRPDIKLVGVTTTFGNGTTEQAYHQTKELLGRVNRTDIPVVKGQATPEDDHNDAAGFLASMVAEAPGEISILATGSLTNLKTAASLDSEFFANVQQIVCMGGYLGPLRIGWRNLAELNLSADPGASFAVLNASCPVTLMTAQLCLQAYFGWSDLSRIRSMDTWFQKTMRDWLLAFGFYCGVGKFYLWDLVPAVYLSYPDLFDSKRVMVTSSESDLTMGRIMWRGEPGSEGKVFLPERILDIDRLKNIIFAAWKA